METSKKKMLLWSLFLYSWVLVVLVHVPIIGILIFTDLSSVWLIILPITALLSLLVLAVIYAGFKVVLMHYKYNRLFQAKNAPFVTNEKILNRTWIGKLLTQGFQSFEANAGFQVLYIVESGPGKQKILVVLVAIFNDDIAYTSAKVANCVNRLLDQHSKKSKARQTFILQFKSYNTQTEESFIDANKVYFNFNRSSHFIVINVNYYPNDKLVYFLHSDKFTPSGYYSLATSFILEKLLSEQPLIKAEK